MIKQKLKRCSAFVLSMVMAFSLFAEAIPRAVQAAPAPATPVAPASHDNFQADNGRPNLFINFLGDNTYYRADGGTTAAPGVPVGGPATYDKSAITNPDDLTVTPNIVTNNIWQYYHSSNFTPTQTIFWVGIGIDRESVFELLKGGQGLTSFEAGFFYNSNFIRPYTGGDYTATLTAANFTTDNTTATWSDAYHIIHAETDLPVDYDAITHEELMEPSLDQITNNTSGANANWKMTYVSLELSDPENTPLAKRRLAGAYNTAGIDPQDTSTWPQEARGTTGYQYLLRIPFVLVQYDYSPQKPLCLRLIRDATHLSIGGGEQGVEPYGAWERVTTRNPGHDIKLLSRFTGDLNIWTGERTTDSEVLYNARLLIDNRGGSQSRAKLSVDQDPSLNPVWIDTHRDLITGLQSGTGMKLEVDVQRGFGVSVRVYYPEDKPVPIEHVYVQTVDGTDHKEYTFVMPAFDPVPTNTVVVEISFYNINADRHLNYLSEIHEDVEDPNAPGTMVTNIRPGDPLWHLGNETTIYTNFAPNITASNPTGATQTNTYDPLHTPHPNNLHPGMVHEEGPAVYGDPNGTVTVDVSTHADYQALVRVYQFSTGAFLDTSTGLNIVAPNGYMTTGGVVVLPTGGKITYPQGTSDMDVEVTYVKAETYKATLEVYHANTNPATPVMDANVAQLAYLVYDVQNTGSTAFSGVVYEDKNITALPERHRAVKGVSLADMPVGTCGTAGCTGDTAHWVPQTRVECNTCHRVMTDPVGTACRALTCTCADGVATLVGSVWQCSVCGTACCTGTAVQLAPHYVCHTCGADVTTAFTTRPITAGSCGTITGTCAGTTVNGTPGNYTCATCGRAVVDTDVVPAVPPATTATFATPNCGADIYCTGTTATWSAGTYTCDVCNVDVTNVVAPDTTYSTPLPWIPASQAALSKSLGGDTGQTGRAWTLTNDPAVGANAITSLLYTSADAAALAGALKGIDASLLEVVPAAVTGNAPLQVGLRKNLQGELYGEGDLRGLANAMWELRAQILADTTPVTGLAAQYVVDVPKSATDPTVAYTYLDLTPAQVQAYILELLEAERIQIANESAYRTVRAEYQELYKIYDRVSQETNTQLAVPIAAPFAPQAQTINATTKVRGYQGPDYVSKMTTGASPTDVGYIAQYKAYLASYRTYITAVDAAGALVDAGNVPIPVPSGVPAQDPLVQTKLRTPADAENYVANYTTSGLWRDRAVKDNSDPIHDPAHTISTREGRTVWVVMQADSAYAVKSVEIYSTTGALLTSVPAVASTSYKNVYSFTMPKQDCIVRVTYELRKTRTLNWNIIGTDGQKDNRTDIDLFSVTGDPADPNDPNRDVVPTRHHIDNQGNPFPNTTNYQFGKVENVFVGSTVTAVVKAATGYKVEVTVKNLIDGTTIAPTVTAAPNPADGNIYTFDIPDYNGDVDITVVYTKTDVKKNTAIIRFDTYTGDNSDPGNSAFWRVENNTTNPPTVSHPYILNDVAEGTLLTADITVAPGYYIYAVSATGASGSYTYILEGNGYNGGYGTSITGTTVPLKLWVTMPGEDLFVDVIFRKGLPPVDPGNALTLTVKDDDNTETDPAKAADNWARARVYDTRVDPAAAAEEQLLGPVGKGNTAIKNVTNGQGITTTRDYVGTGKWVYVDFSAAVKYKSDNVTIDPENSYYVSNITVGPSNLAIAPVRESPTAISFYMKAGSTGVTIEFKQYPEDGILPAYFLDARTTQTDLSNPGNSTPNNMITKAESGTISSYAGTLGYYPLKHLTNPETIPDAATGGGRGAAMAGEQVTMTFQRDPDWYIQSVLLISAGHATRLTYTSTGVAANGIETYTSSFLMPTGGGEFVVHYRKGPKPAIPDYAMTLSLIDDDNAIIPGSNPAAWDPNSITASFTDTTGAGAHPALTVGHNYPYMTDAAHLHAGDLVTLHPVVAPGYTLDYMLVSPSSLHIYPVYQSNGTATFTMPHEGVAVIARIRKGTDQQYTANLILRPPAGCNIKDVGQGTFVLPVGGGITKGSLNNYPTDAIFSTLATPGTKIDFDTFAFDGYYIRAVTIDPDDLGATASWTGTFGSQQGDFVMPAANVNVNVWFEKGWPDEVQYDLTLRVHDAVPKAANCPTDDDNHANFHSAGSRIFTAPENQYIHGSDGPFMTRSLAASCAGLMPDMVTPCPAQPGGPVHFDGTNYVCDTCGTAQPGTNLSVHASSDYTIYKAAYDRDVVVVKIHPAAGYYYDASCISVTDITGHSVGWWYAPGGIAFTMPPKSTRVDVTFKKLDPVNPPPGYRQYSATLHISGAQIGSLDPADDDVVSLADRLGPNTIAADGAVLTGLTPGDILDLVAAPGNVTNPANPAVPNEARYISSVYAVTASGTVLPIYGTPPAIANFVPTGDTGTLAMPAENIHVYVRFAQGSHRNTDLPVTLKVSGDPGAGSADAVIDEAGVMADQTMDVYTAGSTLPGLTADETHVTDTRFTQQGREVTVTFHPTDNGTDRYVIGKLEVYDRAGNLVPYTWESVVQNPPTLTNTNMWPGAAPAPGITHPAWDPNPNLRIKLNVPAGGVTVHVTYVKVDPTRQYRAQVVVNDEAFNDVDAGGNPIPSRNNAWLRTAANNVQKKLQLASPGDWVDLDLTVHPGYRIQYIKVIPQSYGISPSLPLGPLYDQNTGFRMPDGDVTVYVKFADDDIDEKTATLVVTGLPANEPKNFGTISSPRSGQSPRVHTYDSAQSVTARPGIDWVTVDYEWDVTTTSVASVKVETISGTAIPFTQVTPGKLTLPMFTENIIITITFRADPNPVGYPVVLHVIDADGDTANPILRDADGDGAIMDNFAQLTYTSPNPPVTGSSAATNLVGPGIPENTGTIYVPAGQDVDLTVCSDLAGLDGKGPVYIKSAFVLFQQNGQMLNMNLTPDVPGPGFSGLKTNNLFQVHPGRNDVYVYLTRDADEIVANRHSAVLMVRSPSEDKTSEGAISVGTDYDSAPAARRDKVKANDPNDPYAVVTAANGEGMTIQVVPAEGFIIDYIQITPLGFPLDTAYYNWTRNGNTIHFDMPHCNVAITVYLKRGSNQDHTATLHFLQDTGTEDLEDYATLFWTRPGDSAHTSKRADADPTNDDVANNNNEPVVKMTITEGAQVTLTGTLDSPDVILAAFVLWDGALVPLTPTYPDTPAPPTPTQGLEGIGENTSMTDNALFDAQATFTMPAGDVDVYLVVTNDPPPGPWHTVALVATDQSPTGNNSGQNHGTLEMVGGTALPKVAPSTGNPGVQFITVPERDAMGNYNQYRVIAYPGGNYVFDPPATLTRNIPNYSQSISTTSTSPYTYTRDADCNQAVLLNFVSTDAIRLIVEIEDPDNAATGDINKLTAAPQTTPAMTPLNLESNSSAGSYQIIEGITAGSDVNLEIFPDTGYYAYARLHKYDGTVEDIVLTVTTVGGKYVLKGSFPMPPNDTRVTVTFYKAYTGTLRLEDLTGDKTSQAEMTESDRDQKVLVNTATNLEDSLHNLPNTTWLSARTVDLPAGKHVVSGLLTVKGSTTLLNPVREADIDYYKHQIARADAKITLIVDETKATPDADTYLAAVAVNGLPNTVPAGSTDPAANASIASNKAGRLTGEIWTTALKNDMITVEFDIPAGYTATLTTTNSAGAPVALTLAGLAVNLGPYNGGTAGVTDQQVKFDMPAQNVQVTITYRKVAAKLTLRVLDYSSKTNTTNVTDGGTVNLTAHGQSATVNAGTTLNITATAADNKVRIVGAYYQTASGVSVAFPVSTNFLGIPYVSDSFTFPTPAEDTVVTVIYADVPPTPPPGTPPDPADELYYIASTTTVNTGGLPGNTVLAIVDKDGTTPRTTLKDGATPLPASSPNWTAAYYGDTVTVSFQTEPGWYAQVTARDANGVSVPVSQLGITGVGTATIYMPAANAVITVTYSNTAPAAQKPVTLQLVRHEVQAGNKAVTNQDGNAPSLDVIQVDGTSTNHPGNLTNPKATDPVEQRRSTAALGDDLRTMAYWANGYRVVRMTVAVRNTVTYAESPEVDLLRSTYGSSVTSRTPMPPTGTDEEAIIRVYYGNVYEATLHIVGAITGDLTEATDDRATTLTSTNSDPITADLDKLIQMEGGEIVKTTARPGGVVPAPNQHYLVGVVWESALTGAQATTPAVPGVNDEYFFTMPESNVDFYAFYDSYDPADPKGKMQIAKVAFAADSQHLDDSANAVSIENSSDSTLPKGKYWTAAYGGDQIVVNVKVAAGYKAEIITTKIDDPAQLNKLPDIYDDTIPGTRKPLVTDNYQYYTSRTVFVPNLPNGRDSEFTMPLDTDATVTVRFTKGYDLTLEMTDKTTGGLNQTEVDVKQTPTSTQLEAVLMGTSNQVGNTAVGASDKDEWVGDGPLQVTINGIYGGGFAAFDYPIVGDRRLYPAANPGAYVTDTGSSITGLKEGNEVVIEFTPATGISVSNLAIYHGSTTNNAVPRTMTVDGATYRYKFAMPNDNVNINITYQYGGTMPTAIMPASPVTVGANTDSATVSDLDPGLFVDTTLRPNAAHAANTYITLTRSTPFTGATLLYGGMNAPAADPTFFLPSEDTTEVAIYQEIAPGTKIWNAKVERLGDGKDVEGNTATPIIDYTNTAGTIAGTDITTAYEGDGIDLTLTVREGYVAKIKVLRDDSRDANPSDPSKWVFLDAWEFEFVHHADTNIPSTVDEHMVSDPSPATVAKITEVQMDYQNMYVPQSIFPDQISGQQHFRFTMPSEVLESAPGAGDGIPMTNVTVLVEFVRKDDIPRPFDPDTEPMDFIDLERGYIYVDNQGVNGLVRIPTLEQDSGSDKLLYDTDNYDAVPTPPATKAADKGVSKFVFALRTVANDGTETYTELEPGVDINLVPYDEETLRDKGDPYNYLTLYNGTEKLDDATGTARDFVGSKFLLVPCDPATPGGARTPGAQAIYDILNNTGSLERYTTEIDDPANPGTPKTVTRWRTRLFVKSHDKANRESEYTPVWIRPHYTLSIPVIAYGPQHPIEAELYRYMRKDEINPYIVADGGTALTADPDAREFASYRYNETVKPAFTVESVLNSNGSGKWLHMLKFVSADLLGAPKKNYDPEENVPNAAGQIFVPGVDARSLLDNVDAGDNLRYALVIRKAANLPYTRVDMDLNPYHNGYTVTTTAQAVENPPGTVTPGTGTVKWPTRYTQSTKTFLVGDTVTLIAGDVDGDHLTKWQDYDMLMTYIYRNANWDDTILTKPVAPDPDDYTGGTANTTYQSDLAAYNADMSKWAVSIYNRKSLAYRCDLDSNHLLNIEDLNILTTLYNYNRGVEDYLWTTIASGVQVLPFGLNRDKTAYSILTAAYFAELYEDGDAIPYDPVWDRLVDPAVTTAPPLDSQNPELPTVEKTPNSDKTPETDKPADKRPGRDDGEVLEKAEGDEALIERRPTQDTPTAPEERADPLPDTLELPEDDSQTTPELPGEDLQTPSELPQSDPALPPRTRREDREEREDGGEVDRTEIPETP